VLSIADLVRDYGDPLAEALRCRRDCALFDFSFVYRVRVTGRQVIPRIEQFQPRIVSDMSIGQIRYSVSNDGQGRVRSDLTLWRCGEDVFEIMSGRKEDISELRALADEGFAVDDLSETTAILAVQGPNTLAQLARLMDVEPLRKLPYFAFTQAEICAIPCLVGRLGYSGEAGFEFLVEHSQKDRLWDLFSGLLAPAGFAAIDILRIEAGFFLFTNECRVAPSISELGLSALFKQGIASPEIRLVAFRADTRSDLDLILWRSSAAVDRRPVPGEIMVTSACLSPLFGGALGLGFVPSGLDCDGVIDPTNQFLKVKLCSLPPYDPHKSRPRRAWRGLPR
jgi:glycine cleavage system aminomethyltransferase T